MTERSPLTLAELISSLPEEERVILTLHFVKSLSIVEIASRIGAPERAVAAVLTSGRARIAAWLNFPSTKEMRDNSPS